MRVPGAAHPWWGPNRRYGHRTRAGAPASPPRGSRRGSRITLLGRRERACLHRLIEIGNGVEHPLCSIEKWADKLWTKTYGQAEEVLEHEDLPIACHTGADSDRGNVQGGGDFLCQACRDAFEHDRESAEFLEGCCLAEDIPRRAIASALDAKAPVSMNRLGLQAEMTHNGNSALHQPLDHVLVPVHAFQLH